MTGINILGVDTTIDITDDIKQKNPTTRDRPQMSNFFSTPNRNTGDGGLSSTFLSKPEDFSINQWTTETRDASQKRLNDGTYVDKFEDYFAGTNNEERLAQQQSTSDKWVNGLEKLVLKTGNVVLGNTLGFVNGFVEAAKQGSLSAVYDNDFTKTLDDWNTKLDYKLPNYYTQQEKEAGFGASLGSANFWANDVLAGTAFTLGTVASEAIWAYATGGASLALRGARIGSKVGTGTRVLEEGIIAERTLSGIEKMKTFWKQPLKSTASKGLINREGAILGSRIGEGLNTLRFGLTSASGEAAIEAWHYKKEAKENFYNNFESLNGRQPTTEESTKFEEDLANSANAVFATNYLLVGGANLAFFGNQFGIKNPLKSLSSGVDKKLFGIGTQTVDVAGKKTVQALKATKFQNVSGKAYGVSKNLFTEVILEEGLQGVTSKTANKWLESTYDNKNTAQNLDMMGMVYESMGETYGTKEGWKELGTAALTTLIGGAATGNLFGEGSQAIDAKRKEMEYSAAGLNTFAGDIFVKRLAMANQIQGAQERQLEADAKGDLVGGEIARNDTMFSRLNFNYNIKRESVDDISDLQDSMNLMTEEQFKEAGISPENIEQFKTNAVEEYRTLSESFKKNRDFAEAIIGKGQFVGGQAAGINNKSVLIEALTYNLTMGEVTGGLQTDLLTEIKKEILGNFAQSSEFTNSLDIDRVLKNASVKTTKKFNYVKDRITSVGKKKSALEKELVSLERTKNTREDNTTYNQRYAKIAGKLIELNDEYANLVKERNILFNTAKIENPFIKEDVYVSEEDLNTTEDKLGTLNGLIDNLRETNLPAHLKISKLISEYNRSVEQFKEFDNTAKKLSDPKYKPKDQSSFLSKILNGSKSMDEFTREFFVKTIEDYGKVKTEYLQEEAIAINEDISNEEYKTFQDTTEVSPELLDKISQKVKKGEILLTREQEVYNSKKEEVDAIEDTIEVTPPSTTPILSSTEQLVERIENALEENKLSMTYVGEDYNDIINKQPTQEELDEYEGYLEKINNSRRKDKDFAVRVNPNMASDTKAEIGLTKEELIKFQALNYKLSQWRMLDGAVSGESESVADLIEILNQMKIAVEKSETKNTLGRQELIDINETEDMQSSNDATQNSFTQVHDNVTAKIVEVNGEKVVRFSDLNITTIIGNMQAIPTIIDPTGKSGITTDALIEEFGKKKGTQFVFEGATFTIEEKGRISIKEVEFNTIKEQLNLIPLSSNLNHSTYSPVYQKAGEETVQVKSDFVPQSTNVNSSIPYNPDANYTTTEGDIVRFEVRLDDTYNAQLVEKLRQSKGKVKKELAEEIEKNLVIFTVTPNTERTGSLKATHSTAGTNVTDENFLKVRKAAYLALLNHVKTSNTMNFVVPATVQAKKVILGVPNMKVVQTETGYEPLNIDFTDESLTTVVNTGYILNGKSFLSKDDKGVRFDFTTKMSKQNKDVKIPIVVFEYLGNKIAYPISLVTTTIPKGQEVRDILNSELSEVEKVKKINNLLVTNNIEPKQFELTNLDNIKLTSIITEMDNIQDFVDVNDLSDKNYEQELLKTQAQIAIDLTDRPLSAPKLVLDFSKYSGEEFTAPDITESEIIEQEVEDNEITKKIESFNKEIAKLLKKQDAIAKKIEVVEKVYQSQNKVLQAKRAKQSEYYRIEKTRDLALAKLDTEMEILDDQVVDLQNTIEDLLEESEAEQLNVPAETLEEIENLINECN